MGVSGLLLTLKYLGPGLDAWGGEA